MAEVKKEIDLDAEYAKMIARATKDAEKIIADAMAKAGGAELKEAVNKGNAEAEAYLNELVPVKLFKDNNKYKDDVFVSVNGENCLIQRGKEVRIKRKFALVLESSSFQDEQSASFSDQLQSEYLERVKAEKM